MTVRPIDASRFAEILEQWKKDYLQDNDQQSADVISDVILQLDALPTITPPNEPLTPCDMCMFSPPSSSDGKPCCMCPAVSR